MINISGNNSLFLRFFDSYQGIWHQILPLLVGCDHPHTDLCRYVRTEFGLSRGDMARYDLTQRKKLFKFQGNKTAFSLRVP